MLSKITFNRYNFSIKGLCKQATGASEMNTDKDHVTALVIVFMLLIMLIEAFVFHALGFAQGQVSVLMEKAG